MNARARRAYGHPISPGAIAAHLALIAAALVFGIAAFLHDREANAQRAADLYMDCVFNAPPEESCERAAAKL